MKLRIANKVIDKLNDENQCPHYRDSTLARANRRWKASRYGKETESWYWDLIRRYRRWKDAEEAK